MFVGPNIPARLANWPFPIILLNIAWLPEGARTCYYNVLIEPIIQIKSHVVLQYPVAGRPIRGGGVVDIKLKYVPQ
jgi:hypothetical protein